MATNKPSTRLTHRQRVLVALLRGLAAPVAEADLQRLLFLYCRDCQDRGIDPPYEFVPDPQGAHSFTLDADTLKLSRRGILQSKGDEWRLVPDGTSMATHRRDRHASAFVRRYRSLRRGDREALHRITANRTHQATVKLATIGYEGRSYEGFFNELLRVGISLLCDVRRNPVSRKWGFSKRTLGAGCKRLGIDYEHFPELGISSDRRTSLTAQSEYDRLFAAYREDTLARETEALSRIRESIERGQRVALVCYERLSHQCHRSHVAAAVAELPGRLILPRHL